MIYNRATFQKLQTNQPTFNEDIHEIVKAICDNVKIHGDTALKQYNASFDKVELEELELPKDEMESAFNQLDSELKSALIESHKRIQTFQESIKIASTKCTSECYEMYHPLDRIGIYVPGGKASYPSTVLMTATLAQVAGVKEIIVVTPPKKEGINQAVCAACYIAGVDRIFQVGGAQSISALRYGTESIPPVDKIVGPGNQFVAYAKKYLFGEVGIDMIAGPSEIAIVVDETADIETVVFDVFAQAEHDEMARTFVVSESLAVLEAIQKRIQQTLPNVQRRDIIAESLKHHHYLIHSASFEETCQIMNDIAPEHASIQTAHPKHYLNYIYKVGALFLGHYAPEAIGDYVAGPSHVLPTNGNARFANGLSVNDFFTRHSVIHLSKDTFDETTRSAEIIAQEEALFNHAQSLKVRGERYDTHS